VDAEKTLLLLLPRFSMSHSSFAVCLLAGLALSACSSASFSGTTPSRARTLATVSTTSTSTGTDAPAAEPGEPGTGSSSETATEPEGDASSTETGTATEVSTETGTETGTETATDTEPGTETTTDTATDVSTDPDTDPSEPPCQDQTRSIGAQIAFLIDNSQSNEATDCPFPVKTGAKSSSGQPLYRCELSTNREKAVLASFDLLKKIAENEPDNAEAVSSVAVTSFPATELDGFKVQSGWLSAHSDERAGLANLLRFTREPMGQTPYGEAMASAQSVFGSAAGDARGKMAILVTDGLPTDRNPSAVQTKADELRKSGVKVVTVYVTGPAQRSERNADHRNLLSKFESIYQSSNQHWYDVGSYTSFEPYVTAILGLAQGISQNEVVEVQDSAALEKALLSIISQKAIRCER
jgi:hypothetical protein